MTAARFASPEGWQVSVPLFAYWGWTSGARE